jgi:hypothetical protein
MFEEIHRTYASQVASQSAGYKQGVQSRID